MISCYPRFTTQYKLRSHLPWRQSHEDVWRACTGLLSWVLQQYIPKNKIFSLCYLGMVMWCWLPRLNDEFKTPERRLLRACMRNERILLSTKFCFHNKRRESCIPTHFMETKTLYVEENYFFFLFSRGNVLPNVKVDYTKTQSNFPLIDILLSYNCISNQMVGNLSEKKRRRRKGVGIKFCIRFWIIES